MRKHNDYRTNGTSSLRSILLRVSAFVIATLCMAISFGSIPAFAANDTTLRRDGVIDGADVADCTIVADVGVLNQGMFTTNASDTFVFHEAPIEFHECEGAVKTTINGSVFAKYKAPANRGNVVELGSDKYFQFDYENGILDKNGRYHDLHVRISNVKIHYGDSSIVGEDNLPHNRTILDLLTCGNSIFFKGSNTNGPLDGFFLMSWASGIMDESFNYYGCDSGGGNTTRVDANALGHSYDITIWSDETLNYNMFFKDLDMPDRYNDLFLGDWAEGVSLPSGSVAHVESNSLLQTWDSPTTNRTRIVGTAGDSDTLISGFSSRQEMGSTVSNTKLKVNWAASTARSSLFESLSYHITTKAGTGGKAVQIAGQNPASTPIALGDDKMISEGSFVKQNDLDAVPKNDYTIRMDPDPGYVVKEVTLDGTSLGAVDYVSIPKISADHVVTVLFERAYGSLSIKKNVTGSGASQSKTFHFTVTLMNGNTPVSDTYGGCTFTNGKYEFDMKASDAAKTISGIPIGYTYEVSETTDTDYTASYTNKTGTIERNAATLATVTNAKHQTQDTTVTNEPKTGKLTVKKVVSGTTSTQKFDFKVTLTDASNNPVNKTFGSGTSAVQFTNGQASFQLGHNETKEIEGIPFGYKYAVSEETPSGWGVSWSVSGGTSESGTIAGDVTVTATNSQNAGGFTVKKVVTNNVGNEDDSFSFTVTLKDTSGQPAKGDVGNRKFNDNGQHTFTLKHNQTYQFSGIPSGYTYEVSETANDRYTTTWSPNPASGTVSPTSSPTITATNARKTGKLTVKKEVSGVSTTDKFDFTVTLKDGNTAKTGTFGGCEFGSTGYTFSLGHGESKVIDGIPTGWTYEVTEAANDKYTTTWTPNPATGAIDASSDGSTVTAKNTRKVANLTIKKVVDASTTSNKKFDFEVTLKNEADQNVSGAFGEGANTVSFTNGKLSFSLGHNETKVIYGIPVGYKYSVTESADSTWSTTWSASPTSSTPQSGTISANTTVTATNKLLAGGFTVKKVVTNNNGNEDDSFKFTVTLKNGNDPVSGEIGGHTFDSNGQCSFSLKHNGEEAFTGIPSGCTYEVTEQEYSRYETTWSDNTKGTISATSSPTVLATNKRKVGDLIVKKTRVANGDPTNEEFSFTVTLTDGDAKKSGTFGGCEFDKNGQYTFTLHGGEQKEIKGIPTEWNYAVTETANNKYETTWEGDPVTGAIGETAKTVTAKNTRKVGKLTIAKILEGTGAETAKDFSFNVTLKNGNTAMTGTFGGCQFTETGYTFTLKGGASKTIEGIPTGWTYTVTETADDKYDTKWTPNPATGTIGDDESTVTATNVRKTGKLTVKKVTTGAGADLSKKFSFTVTLKNGNTPVSGEFSGLTFDSNGQASFQLGHNETKEIAGIPSGYAYTVTEAPADGYTPSWANDTGTITTGNDGVTATCTNELIRGDLKFVKVDEKTQEPMPGVVFLISNPSTKEQHVMVTDKNGVIDTSSAAVPHTTNTNANDAGISWNDAESMWVVNEGAVKADNGIWFHGSENGNTTPDNNKGALPYGSYKVEELRCEANRGYDMVKPFTVTINKGGANDSGKVDNTPPDPQEPGPEHGNTVTIYKDCEPEQNSKVNPDDEITYTMLLRNTGKDPQPRTIVRDYIPVGTEYVEGSASNDGVFVAQSPEDSKYGQGRAYVEWAVDDMLPCEERTVTFKVKVLHSVGRYVFNTAYMRKTDKTVTPGDPSNTEPEEESNTVMHRTTDIPTPSFVKTVKTSVPVPGTQVAWNSEIAYTLHVSNTGGTDATQVGVFDPVPAGTEVSDLPEEYSATLTQDKRGIGWLIPELKVGATVELHFTVKVTDHEMVKNAGVVRNQASWGSLTSMQTPVPPSSNLDNTTNIIEHPLYEPPFEDAETYKWSDPVPETVVKNGDEITYQLTTTNTGSAVKPFVLLRDYIPEGTEYVDGSADEGGVYVAADAEGNQTGKAYVEWLLESIKPGNKALRTFKVTVTEDWHSYIRNHAKSETITTPVTPGDPSNPEPSQTTNEVKHPTKQPDEDKFPYVSVVKGSRPKPNTMVDLGSEITYTLDVQNDGSDVAYDVRIFDAVPEGTELVSVKEDDKWAVSATDDKQGIGWLIKQLDMGEASKVTLEFTVKVVSKDVKTLNSKNQKVIRNQASWSYTNAPIEGATVPTTDEGMGNHTNIVEHPLLKDPKNQTGSQVSAYKDSDPEPNSVVEAGQEITYVVNLKHTGNAPQAATLVRDYIPEGTTYVDGSADSDGVFVQGENPYVEWVVGEMKTGEEKRVSFKVTVNDDAPTYIRNMAIYEKTETGKEPGDPTTPDPGLNTNEVWHTTDPDLPTPAVIQVVKSAEPVPGTPVKVGDTIKYTLHVTNTGGKTAVNWGVHDALQEGLELVDGSVSSEHHGTVVNDGRGVAWVIESLEPGAFVDLSFSVKVVSAQIRDDLIQNQATWGKRSGVDDIPVEPMVNTSNIVEHPLLREPKPVITKTTLTKGAVRTGQVVEFLVTVRNEGNADVVDHVLVDKPEPGLVYDSDDKNGVKQNDGTAVWRGITLAPGQEFQVHVKCKVTATKAGQLRNVAILYRPDGTKLVAIGDAEAIVTVMVASDLIRTGVTVGAAGAIGVSVASGIAIAMIRRRHKMQ